MLGGSGFEPTLGLCALPTATKHRCKVQCKPLSEWFRYYRLLHNEYLHQTLNENKHLSLAKGSCLELQC